RATPQAGRVVLRTQRRYRGTRRVGFLSLDLVLLLHQDKKRGIPVGSSSLKLAAEILFIKGFSLLVMFKNSS
ncbi:MAG: hypothetical protein ACP5PS_03335, partial [Bacteroidales bacterium]